MSIDALRFLGFDPFRTREIVNMATKRKTAEIQIPVRDMAFAEVLAASARYNEATLTIARLIGRQIAREQFEQQASAENAPVARADKMR